MVTVERLSSKLTGGFYLFITIITIDFRTTCEFSRSAITVDHCLLGRMEKINN